MQLGISHGCNVLIRSQEDSNGGYGCRLDRKDVDDVMKYIESLEAEVHKLKELTKGVRDGR